MRTTPTLSRNRTATPTTPSPTVATGTPVRAAEPADHETLAWTLAGAFHDDPVFRWITPDDERRRSILPGVFAMFTDVIAPQGASLVAADGAGAALWVPPGNEVVAADEADAFERALVQRVGEDVERMGTCMAVLEEAHPHEPCWYLNLLGVVPGHQGEGIGSAMLRAALERSDADGVPAYLEATSPQNRRLYERHGFVVERELTLPDGPSLWAMWRAPRAS